MFKLIGTILSILKPLLSWFFSPKQKFQRDKNENARIIEQHDEDAINRRLDDRTDRL